MTQLSIRKVSKSFGGQPALEDINLDVSPHDIVCLLGPSGCGKTTLLRIIAGLESADAGQVFVEGADIGPAPPHQRDFGLMFQDYALFPHKNVFDNIAFGLRMSNWDRRAISNRVQKMLALVGLEGFARRSVNDLSGGEAQRVALARSLAPRPRLLMLDEPLGALDRALRERLMFELRDILKQVGVTTIYVTHDQTEAFAIADQVVVMNKGHIEQVGPPEQIYRHPATPFVATFLGLSNLGPGKVIGPGQVSSPWGNLFTPTGDFQVGQPANVLIRPEAAIFALNEVKPESSQTNILSGQLIGASFRGSRYRLKIQPEIGPVLSFDITMIGALPFAVRDTITFCLDPVGVVLLSS